MSNAILEIPAQVVPDARRALFELLGDAMEHIAQPLTQSDHEFYPGVFVEGRDLFERVCALLDVIGWDGTPPPQATSVDVIHHGETLKAALERYLRLVENWRDEAASDDGPSPSDVERERHEELTRSVRSIQEFLSLLQTRDLGRRTFRARCSRADRTVLPDHDEGARVDELPSADVIEDAVLLLLLDSIGHGTWSMQELSRALGGDVQAADAVANLHSAGLVHRLGEFVFATRAAARARAIHEAV